MNMNHRTLIAAAACMLFTLMMATPAIAWEEEKRYGIADAGKNDCAKPAGKQSLVRWSIQSGNERR